MKITLARVITYSVIGAAALVSLWLTPPVTQNGRPAQVTALISGEASESPDTVSGFAFGAIVVPAARLPGIDTIALGGTITSSLYAALDRTGEEELPRSQRRALAWNLAEIFQYRIDMSRDLGQGDHFNVLLERIQEPDGRITINKILAARFSVRDEQHEAIRFQSRNNRSEWYDGNGKSLTASFLRAPLEFRRVSSGFGGRTHPISGTWRQHTGTDYAASAGTPIRAIGDGVVISVGRNGGYGNMIDIRHSNGYVSRYGHMSRFAKNIRRGSRVSMGSTIGYVGSTGWATGPHLHFEIRVNGVPRDPRVALRRHGDGAPLTGVEAKVFQETRALAMAALGAGDPLAPGIATGAQLAATRKSTPPRGGA